MIETIGKTQQKTLSALLATPQGLTIDELIAHLGVTRTAIRQHVTYLSGLDLIRKGKAVSTGGRPSQYYVLSEKGHNLFPKQYSLFSELLLTALIGEKGKAGMREWLSALGTQVAQMFADKVTGERLEQRAAETVKVMNMLAYQADIVTQSGSADIAIEAHNCVYHNLAAEHREVCAFDRALLSGLVGQTVVQEKCLQDGDAACRFCFKKTL